MFDIITERTHRSVDAQIGQLKIYCNNDPAVAEFMRYLIAYSNEMGCALAGSIDARIGKELTTFIWQISNVSLNGIGNSIHFMTNWAAELHSFIGNYFYDDAAFDFYQDVNGAFSFKASLGDYDRWLQNPLILVEAAKVNQKVYNTGVDCAIGELHHPIMVDCSKVYALINE